MRRYFYFILLTLFFLNCGLAQSLFSTRDDTLFFKFRDYVPVKKLVLQHNPRKSMWIPIVESIGLNIALGAFNRYVMQSEFAEIDIETMKHNHELGWTTDADAFSGNMWGHPFHGSIYYNLARSSGYSYWTSLGIGAIGSWQWEFFMENEPPALNDWIMTSFAGSMMGEMFYRFSNLILDESLSGSDRTWNEIAAGVFNPGRLFNRLIYGRTARVTTEKLYERKPFLGELGLGMNNVGEGTDLENGQKNGLFSMDFAYGRLFDKKHFNPFDFFRFYWNINFGGVQPVIGQFRIQGMLYGETSSAGNGGRFMWGIFNHYDYLENTVYQLGSVSIGPSVGYRTKKDPHFQYIGMLHGALQLMGAANSDYASEFEVPFLDSARTYNMGPGAHFNTEHILRFSFGSFVLAYDFWWTHTWDGAPGDEYSGMARPQFRFRLYDRWHLGLEWRLYHRFSDYDEFPNREYDNYEQRLFIAYTM